MARMGKLGIRKVMVLDEGFISVVGVIFDIMIGLTLRLAFRTDDTRAKGTIEI